ncbi:carboxymuconolactone decarboxylase family protein [Kribbella jiaozuonensis]|uniref:Carboxymuconolactone decarboxylase family protein n=1 Tax=Kribbella jiaozuonensis TaxID=2575441 RepID=A0A4U3M4A3_9ACTN|nr:carboxymuconolactone decarboxylase family protein [Kribbella jiaozuonensis]TKK83052.1 carboxymuconolactone decarboxylase family protein [Kribbella jiaozuonensis]
MTAPDINSPDEQIRYQRGLEVLNAVDGGSAPAVMENLADIAPALAHHIVAFGFGDIYSRPGLDPKQRQLVTLGILTALGGCEPQLEVHIRTSLNVGLTPTEIVETFTHAAGYAGFPRALNAITIAKKVFTERNLLPVKDD